MGSEKASRETAGACRDRALGLQLATCGAKGFDDVLRRKLVAIAIGLAGF
jgi:hypothetical protein